MNKVNDTSTTPSSATPCRTFSTAVAPACRAGSRRTTIAYASIGSRGGLPDTPLFFGGTDFAVLAPDGRLKAVTGFTDAMPAS